MRDLEITATDTWTDPFPLDKGDKVSVSVKGSFTGTIKVRRWLREYGTAFLGNPVDVAKHVGVIQEYTIPIESVDDSGGAYYYQVGTDDTFSGTAYVHVQ